MKIVCIVQARMGSERLAGKVMKPLMERPMIEYTLKRLAKSKYIDEIVLATSEKETENILCQHVEKIGFKVFRGEELNVLKRYKEANDFYKGDIVLRVTGDCPLIDPVIVDNAITYFLANDFDYIRADVPDTLIRGFDVEVFRGEVLNQVYDILKEEDEKSPYKEHVTLYIYRNPDKFKVGVLPGSSLYNRNYRLCVDTQEDFCLLENIYAHFSDMFVSGKEVIKYLDENPHISEINSDINQKKV